MTALRPLTLLMPVGLLFAQAGPDLSHSTDTPTIRLWEGAAPGALGNDDADIPTLTWYAPAHEATDAAIIVAPGGSYHGLASNHEGRQVANFLNAAGLTAFVLKYRLGPRYHHPIELGDAQRAITLVRSRADEFGVSPHRIGIMGFSAGGHLASSASTHYDATNRPDFAILVYPVISLTAPYTHQGSLHNLLGDTPDPKLAQELSSELQVTANTPPTFLFSTSADTTVPPENSVAYYMALHKAGVPAELHIFQNGAHGVGLGLDDPALSVWPTLLLDWLRVRGLLSKPQP
ncbi:MAG TPA: alpha/beta hydrolase [Bryobacteraceae bacterium]|nr:alpha/beta hydrolase [Bryobacteraceae bacterium]